MKNKLDEMNERVDIDNIDFYEAIYQELVQAGLFKEGTTLNDN